ncbi:MAG: response regulator [Xanthomonadales bacterium]|nr:response regulator [Xanthomonadales bacterium]
MTRMAIHTAAGFIMLGIGFIAFAWSRYSHQSATESLPGWIPRVIGITGLTITFALWQALSAQEQRMVDEMGASAANFSDEGLLIFGIVLTLTLAFKARTKGKVGHAERESSRIYAPYVVIVLGALLSTSLYSLLQTSFESSVKQRFEAAAINHTEAIEYGIDTYIETLYYLRSGFDASSFVDRDEFRTLVSRKLLRSPGIMALLWVPKVDKNERADMEAAGQEEVSADFVFVEKLSATGKTTDSERDVYYPIYFIEPQEKLQPALGFDLAANPAYLTMLMKAVNTNTPVISSRIRSYLVKEDAHAVFVALPVFKSGLPEETTEDRELALKGFVVMVIEIGPMIEAILKSHTRPAGLTLTFADTGAGDEQDFMYRHISRKLDLGQNNKETDFLDEGLSSETALTFADRQWQVTAHAANNEIYPDWNANNFWLSLGVLLLSLGLAWFLFRIKESQKRFHALIESAPDAMVIINESGKIVMVNQRTEELFGYPRNEITDQPIEMLLPKRFREQHPEHVRSFFTDPTARGMGKELELFGISCTGREFPVEISLSPIETASGTLVASSVRDITDRKQAELKLAKQKEYYETLIGHLNFPAFVINAEHEVVIWNKSCELLTGLQASEIIGTNEHWRGFYATERPCLADLVLDKDFKDVTTLYETHADHPFSPEGKRTQNWCPMPTGKNLYLDIDASPICDEEGNVIAVMEVLSDITERKRMADELSESKDLAEAANQAKSAFLANMSHELRTPMNAILGYSEMLIEEAEDLEQEDSIPDLKKIHQSGTHLLALINDVLDLSKIESGKMEAFAEEIDLDTLIDEVSATAHPLLEKNKNTLAIERGKDIGMAYQDIIKLRQALFNLLSNAAKFTHEGTVTLHVNRTEQDGVDWLTFAVSDTGIGIAEDKIDHVFQEFAQADDSTTRDYGGTGLGLAISKRFCKLLGGDLSLFSELDYGSTFTIRIPAILPGAKPQTTSAESSQETSDTDLASIRGVAPGSTILVIDDDTEACEIIERYLIKDDFNVVTANSGEQGLRLAREIHPAAITLDVMMPGMDGWTVLQVLKADPELHNIPVIMLSMIDDRTRGYSLGAVDYLTKPVDRELLHKTLSRYYCPDGNCPVLLIEDDVETREIMAHTLEKNGWKVSEANNGQEALDMMADVQPRLILLDLMMPVMDGFGFLAEMRTNPEWQDIPVIVITAKDLTAEDRDRLSGCVEEVLEKNAYSREQLLKEIREAVAACNISQSDTNAT